LHLSDCRKNQHTDTGSDQALDWFQLLGETGSGSENTPMQSLESTPQMSFSDDSFEGASYLLPSDLQHSYNSPTMPLSTDNTLYNMASTTSERPDFWVIATAVSLAVPQLFASIITNFLATHFNAAGAHISDLRVYGPCSDKLIPTQLSVVEWKQCSSDGLGKSTDVLSVIKVGENAVSSYLLYHFVGSKGLGSNGSYTTSEFSDLTELLQLAQYFIAKRQGKEQLNWNLFFDLKPLSIDFFSRDERNKGGRPASQNLGYSCTCGTIISAPGHRLTVGVNGNHAGDGFWQGELSRFGSDSQLLQ